jgi:ferritin-like metal-binding protein YciE
MTIKTMQDLFIHELSDIYSAEKQLAKALGRLSRAADNSDLSKAFDKHLEETTGRSSASTRSSTSWTFA